MSTRSYIGYVDKDNKIHFSYCHFDGYLAGVGETLLNYYNSSDRAIKLVDGGDMSSLDKDGADYYENIKTNLKVVDINEFNEILQDSWCEYCYLYDKEWVYKELGEDGWGDMSHWDKLEDKFDKVVVTKYKLKEEEN